MNRLWWQLPGPDRFVSRVTASLRTGSTVVLRLPAHFPHGLGPAVHSRLKEKGGWDWRSLSIPDEDVDPSYQVYRWFEPIHPPDIVCNPKMLAHLPVLAGRVVWLGGLTARTWPAWKAFFTEFAQATKQLPEHERVVFCVPLSGEIALDPPTMETCLTHETWAGCVTWLDMLLFASYTVSERSIPDLHRRLIGAIATNVAMWDPELCMRLTDEPIERVMHPRPILEEMARERGWDAVVEYKLSDLQWAVGVSDKYGKATATHSAALVSRDPSEELERRIWSAETSVLLPFVEDHRRSIVQQVSNLLRVPVPGPVGPIIDKNHLEIGHIHHQLKHNPRVVPSLKRLINDLWEIRNSLAHLTPLLSEQLLTPSITALI